MKNVHETFVVNTILKTLHKYNYFLESPLFKIYLHENIEFHKRYSFVNSFVYTVITTFPFYN